MANSGNHLVDNFDNDRRWHYPAHPVCIWCDDMHYVHSIPEWISAARECQWMSKTDNSFRRALAECHRILIEGKTDCPVCS